MSSMDPLVLYQAVIWLRYLRFVLDLVQYYCYFRLPHIRVTEGFPTVSEQDFTIVSWTLGDQIDYVANISSWIACNPAAIIIVTIDEKLQKVCASLEVLNDKRIQVYSIRKASAREQASEGIRRTATPFMVFVDDDVKFSSSTLHQIAIAFSDPVVGGVNTMQKVCPRGLSLTVWESFAALNLVRRNILHSFVAHLANGHVLNLSGRTVAYRAKIFQREDFYSAFLEDRWRGRYHLRTGDDNFLTSWVVQQGWQTRFINDKCALITTTESSDSKYLKQLLRWSRDTARGYLRDSRFAIQKGDGSFRFYCAMKILANYTSDLAVAFEIGALLTVTLSVGYSAIRNGRPLQLPPLGRIWTEHICAVGALQLFEHAPFFLTKRNILHVPGAILYTYVHSVTVLRAFCSLDESVWGSRPGADTPKRD